jgi:ATP-dependent DNA helicase RecQ
VQQINVLLNHNINTLLIAPTGWGKTTLLIDLIKESPKYWIYLAPLRALANEFYLRCAKKIKGVVLISHYHEVKDLVASGLEFKLLIITPELLTNSLVEHFGNQPNYVFDEIHLFYNWGESFRPRLMECYQEVMFQESAVLSLTATMSEKILEAWQKEAQFRQTESYKIEIKNHSLKKEPKKVAYIPSPFKSIFEKEFLSQRCNHTKLIFCAYRQQVDRLKTFVEKNGFSAITCIGGETHFLAARLEENPKPDFIIGTSAISHGVNLPKISQIYLSYPVQNYDFWIQMVGRGGRQGEEFKVYSRDKYRITKLSWILSVLYLLTLKLKAKIYPYELRRYFNS